MTVTHFGSDNQSVPRLIAFYLTQFHPTPENDLWWGKGFTEWTNATKAKPLFEGHYQPHLPADLGFYDLRLRETRHQQIGLAKQFGIDGFCYHYYWFSGTRILHGPLDDMLADKESDMPFCLCWANENWTRRWDAAEHEILIAQKYLPDDDLNFIKSLIPFFRDARYIRLNNEPVLIVYRPQHLPDPRKTAKVWRDYCASVGIGKIHLCAALTHGNEDFTQFGFDSGVEFPPHNMRCGTVNHRTRFFEPFQGWVVDYKDIAESYMSRRYPLGKVFRTVFPSWDNTARANNRAGIVTNACPENYEYWLSRTIQRTMGDLSDQEPLVFINAWNEWAEGCHLEPDRKHGQKFLQATLNAKRGRSRMSGMDEILRMSIADSAGVAKRTVMGDLRAISSYHLQRVIAQARGWLNHYPRMKHTLRRLRLLFG